jgi:hypothetical protein
MESSIREQSLPRETRQWEADIRSRDESTARTKVPIRHAPLAFRIVLRSWHLVFAFQRHAPGPVSNRLRQTGCKHPKEHYQCDEHAESIEKLVHLVDTRLATFGYFLVDLRGLSRNGLESPIKPETIKRSQPIRLLSAPWSMGMWELLSKGTIGPSISQCVSPRER